MNEAVTRLRSKAPDPLSSHLPRTSDRSTTDVAAIKWVKLRFDQVDLMDVFQHQRPIFFGPGSIRALPNLLEILRTLPTTKGAFAEFTDDEILRAMDAEGAAGSPIAVNPRIAEFDLLASGLPIIGNDAEGSFLYAETLNRSRLALAPRWDDLLQGVVKVHRLREVTCLYGFTRLEPPPTSAESELDEIQLAVDGADLARDVTWLPAIEQFREGIFLHISPTFLKDWLEKFGDGARILQDGERRDAEHFNRPPIHLGAAYWALHSLSHSLMTELALECGYPISSLKERIYASGAGQANPARRWGRRNRTSLGLVCYPLLQLPGNWPWHARCPFVSAAAADCGASIHLCRREPAV